jgi:hypothetical protein
LQAEFAYFNLGFCVMTKLSPLGSRSPLSVYPNLSDEDRSTYRRWARAWYICCSIFVAGLLAVGLSSRVPHLQAGMQSQTVVGSSANARPAGQPHPGG